LLPGSASFRLPLMKITAIIQECYDSGHIILEFERDFDSLDDVHAYCKRHAASLLFEADYVRAITPDGEFLSDSRYVA
jgi:hypothetical protein